MNIFRIQFLFTVSTLFFITTALSYSSLLQKAHCRYLDEKNAVILSQGKGTDGFINEEYKKRVEQALSTIKSQCPELSYFSVQPKQKLKTITITLTKEGKELLNHQGNLEHGITGIRKLDRLNQEYSVSSLSRVYRFLFFASASLKIHFEHPMDIPALIKRYEALPEVKKTQCEIIKDQNEYTIKLTELSEKIWEFEFVKYDYILHTYSTWEPGVGICVTDSLDTTLGVGASYSPHFTTERVVDSVYYITYDTQEDSIIDIQEYPDPRYYE